MEYQLWILKNYKKKPDVIVIFAWNFSKDIIEEVEVKN